MRAFATIRAREMEMSSGGGRYIGYSPSPSTAPQSPHVSGIRSATSALIEHDRYLSDLLAEREKLGPFAQVLPHSCRLLNEEILRVTILLKNASFIDQTGLEHASPLTSGGLYPNVGADRNLWATTFRTERLGCVQSPSHGWHGGQGSTLVCKKSLTMEIPVDKYPSYNFVGRLLGPRGNSLKRVEATTGCRVMIRGRGSIKDPAQEELVRGKPGYEHLNEPLHIVIEAELPVEIIDGRLMQAREILEDLLKPVDESQDYFKKQQLRELAILNGTLRDDNSQMSGFVSPFHNNLGMKRAKTRG